MNKPMTDEDRDGRQALGFTLMLFRRSRSLTIHELCGLSGVSPASLSRYETGHTAPKHEDLLRLMRVLKIPMGALDRAQELVGEAMCKPHRCEEDDGDEPAESPGPPPEVQRKAALRLAQEAGKAVAHCCLAFLELQAGGWERDGEPAALGSAARGE
jgi:transcriptional regulator with XRE-family HTH domain